MLSGQKISQFFIRQGFFLSEQQSYLRKNSGRIIGNGHFLSEIDRNQLVTIIL